MQKLGKNVYVETGYDWANVAAVITDEGAVLIDCPVRPTDSAHWQEVVRGLHPRGARHLIATDYHGDHISGTSFIEGVGDRVSFLAPQVAFDEISKGGDNAYSKKMFVDTLNDLKLTEEATRLAEAAVPLPTFCWKRSMVLHAAPLTFEITLMGGHSPGTSAILVPEEGILFASDVVNARGGGMGDAHLGDWIRALEWIETLDVHTIVPGHGDVCDMEVVRRQRERMVTIKGAVADLIGKGLSRSEAMTDAKLESQFFHADTSRGEYWLKQRRETFQKGISRIYDEVKGEA
ncbi:MBL fold metallo-hydrolase [Ancylobacter sp. Lp-2]|uniref:MBL fold metallo-hydrolase n=1 Tax=Ancylobacter sp. Lp-2 TaxID=2881339 RepID=UPI001E54601B|nr:MBL fold metallo-hydrolase [Ancylobacter sp. Lp-2]MCB4770404.1 MBL fold metallo-hydrolase [Ancylobacter sp. Lp-2]